MSKKELLNLMMIHKIVVSFLFIFLSHTILSI